jgi:hypothetical protein
VLLPSTKNSSKLFTTVTSLPIIPQSSTLNPSSKTAPLLKMVELLLKSALAKKWIKSSLHQRLPNLSQIQLNRLTAVFKSV